MGRKSRPHRILTGADSLLSPKQVALIDSTNPVTLSDGSIRSGKTLADIIAFITWIQADAPPGPLAIIGVTRDTINRNILEQIDLLDPSICTWRQNGTTCKIFGRTVHRISGNDARAESKIRGLTLAGALVDEATLMPQSMFVQLLGRLSISGARLFASTNPDNPRHWLKTDYLDRIDDLGWHHQHFTMRDNPGLTAEYVEAKEREFTGLFYRRFILGEWVAAEGSIYPTFDHAKHVVDWYDMPPTQMGLAIGIDYGTTNASSAIALYLGQDNRLYLADEWRIDQSTRLAPMTDSELSDSYRQWLTRPHHPTTSHPISQHYVDPAAASFKTQLKRDQVKYVRDANNQVNYGIKLVGSLIATDRLRVSTRCTGFLQEVSGYAWDSKAATRGEDKPVKTNDHSMDAARYAITSSEAWWRTHIPQT